MNDLHRRKGATYIVIPDDLPADREEERNKAAIRSRRVRDRLRRSGLY